VDIIVIGRNEAQHLARVLATAQASAERMQARHGLPARLCYVDSGSTDDSRAIAALHGARVTQAHPGYRTAANGRASGLALTNGEYVFLLDGDCEVHPDWLTEGLAYLMAHPEAGGVGGRGESLRQVGGQTVRVCERREAPPEGEEVRDHIGTGGHGFLARRAALEQAGGYEAAQISQEEALLYCRMWKQGWAVRRIPAAMMTHLDDDLADAERGWRKFRGLAARHGLAKGSVLRRALLAEKVGAQILAFYRLELAHGLWLTLAGGMAVVAALTGTAAAGWGAAALTGAYLSWLYRRKQSLALTLAALPLVSLYVLGMAAGFAFNRPRTAWGIQMTAEYQEKVAELNPPR
jgi:glycosyltransferase involved in cell wall biosynthesis